MCAATAATAVSLSSAFVSHEGSNGGLKSISVAPWKSKQRQVRRAGAGLISAKFDLKPPPYPFNALEPHMSKSTIELHWGKHHRAYVDDLNKQIAGTELNRKSLEDVVRITYNCGCPLPAFDNAAQAWNHAFFWESMKPRGWGKQPKPSRDLLEQINKDFGSFDDFVYEFKAAAATQFGPGWAWLVYKSARLSADSGGHPKAIDDGKKLAVFHTSDAMTPLVCYDVPLLAIDLWEHAYYLDYQNRRLNYINAFLNELVNWDAVNARYKAAKAAAPRNREGYNKMHLERSRRNARRVLWVYERLHEKLKSAQTDSKSERIATKGH